jgi:tRNA (cytidine/uridine-2'-O-)-methyltransferase
MPLNLIAPLGFSLEDRYLKRAGLDYWPYVNLRVFPDWMAFLKEWTGGRLIGTSARQGKHFTQYNPENDDGLVFGKETGGLPADLLAKLDLVFNVPLRKEVRSLNLATTVGFFLGVALSRKA